MQNQRTNNQADEIAVLLSAAVLAPGLRSVLVFDASQEELRLIAQAVARLLQVVSPEPVSTITLQATHNDDQLWGNFIPRSDLNDSLFWQPGLLAPDDDDKSQIVLIPDLAQLSLMAARSAIMLVGEQVASLERHGQHRLWRPGLFWIAGCATSDVGKVSAHLLDRFALRLNRQKRPDSTAGRVAKLRELLNNTPVEASDFFRSIDDAAAALKTARVKPQIDDDVFNRLFEYVGESSSNGTRRDLALARLAVAKARLDHKEVVGVEHVDEAAKIIGLRRSGIEHVEKPEEKDSSEPERADQHDSKADSQVASDARPSEVSAPVEQKPAQQLVEQLEAEPEPFPTAPLPAATQFSPYPEDNAAMEHEANPLRLPSHTAKKSEAAKGAAIGTERATSLRDLAIARSFLEAAKFQPIRRKHNNAPANQFLILPPDLHSYRREPVAEQMLVMVMDYTSLKETAWEEALFPYIKEAYTERALVCVVKVGAADSRQELRAERVEARSILVPSVAHAFDTEPGRATPLAHGLDLAYQTLRRHLQHGRGGPYRATLVIVSDGRGNVPLEASRKAEIFPPVLRRGFDDALSVARQIKSLDHVRIVLLNPASDQYPEMPSELASALGAQLREIQVSSKES